MMSTTNLISKHMKKHDISNIMNESNSQNIPIGSDITNKCFHSCEISDSFVKPKMKLSNGRNGNGEARLFISNSREITNKIIKSKKMRIKFDENYISQLQTFVEDQANFRETEPNRPKEWIEYIKETDNAIIIISQQNGDEDINRNYIGQEPHRRKKNKTQPEYENIKKWDRFRACVVPTLTTLQFYENMIDNNLSVYVTYNKNVHKYNKPSGCSFISLDFFKKFGGS